MTISQRATAAAGVREMPEHERPLSEQFRVVAKKWVDENAAADLLEDTKQIVFSEIVMRRTQEAISAVGGDGKAMDQIKATSNARMEHMARASQEWRDHITATVEARRKANLSRMQMKYLEMRFGEWQSADANQRKERSMGRQAT